MTERMAAERLHSACIHLLRRVRRVDPDTGLGPSKLSALSVLVFGGPCTLGELAAAEEVRPPSMTRIVQELESQGLVRRCGDKADRRVVRLEPTRDAVRILKQGRSRRAKELARWIRRLPPGETERLHRAVPVLEALARIAREL